MTFVDVFAVPIGMVTLITMSGLFRDFQSFSCPRSLEVLCFWGTISGLCSFHLGFCNAKMPLSGFMQLPYLWSSVSFCFLYILHRVWCYPLYL